MGEMAKALSSKQICKGISKEFAWAIWDLLNKQLFDSELLGDLPKV